MIRWFLSLPLRQGVWQTLYMQNRYFACVASRTNGENATFMKSPAKKVCSWFSTLPKTANHDWKSSKSKVENGNTFLANVSKEEAEILATKQLDNLSPEDERRLKILKLEYDSFHSLGKKVPNQMTNLQWLELLHGPRSQTGRLKKYKFWLVKEVRAHKKETKKMMNIKNLEAKRTDRAKENENRDPDDTSHLRFMQRIRESAMLQHYYSNLWNAMQFGPDIVFDFGFEDHMTQREITNLVSQMKAVHGVNKIHREPFHIIMCNVQPDKQYYNSLVKGPGAAFSKIPLTITDKHYLDLFPKEKLVYLSPNAQNTLEIFDPAAVYIVGGIVDKAQQEPLTFAKAKREGVRSAKLPLDVYLDWGQGSKSLTLVHMMNIMLTLHDTRDWQRALQHIPKRKLKVQD